MSFAFDSLDDRPVSSEVSRGKPAVLAFVTTGSLPAQAQVDFLVTMSRNDGDKVFYAVVSLDPRENRELVEIYRKSLGIKFPVAMADEATLAGAGPFGDVSTVPVTILLDRLGRMVWRVDGRVVKSDELRDAMRGL
jgi:thiol-disulfide isomerase/thioredoxin